MKSTKIFIQDKQNKGKNTEGQRLKAITGKILMYEI